jgi:uncharacterized protein with HEPN domain
MLEHAREAVEMVAGRRREDLDTDRQFNLARVRLLEVIGEASARVPEEFRSRHAAVPWPDIADLRNRLIHGYDAVNFDMVWAIVRDDLPPLTAQLDGILSGAASCDPA